jgi:hypothetical protein
MKAALAKGTSGSSFVVYPDAGHAFHADYRPSYVEKDAKDGWTRALAWFKRARRGLIRTDPAAGHGKMPGLRRCARIKNKKRLHDRPRSHLHPAGHRPGRRCQHHGCRGVSFTLLSKVVERMVSLSVGIMLSTSLLHALPEAFESHADPRGLFATLLGGLLAFFLLEKVALLRHSHHHEGDGHHHPTGTMRSRPARPAG